jgi:hypothetical protein
MEMNIREENGRQTWARDARGPGATPEGFRDAVYDRSFEEMVQDLNEYVADGENAGLDEDKQDIVAWSLFEAISEVLGMDSPEAQSIYRLAGTITAFMVVNAEAEYEDTDDERSELAA